VFVHELEVRVGDLNYGRHLGHDALISLLHQARVRFLASRGASELDTDGLGMVVADLAVRYRAEAFLGDRLRVEIGIGERSAKSCDLHYRVTNLTTERLVAEAKTGVVFVDREGCVARLPAVLSGT
jgi:acyl-CoA thioesterase FadM